MTNFSVCGADDLALHCYEWLPPEKAKAVIHIAHGMSEHAARYQAFAMALTDAGYAVFAHDHRGHGLSLTKGQSLGHMADEDSWNKAVHDIHAVNQEIQRRMPNRQIVLLGHSMGSFLAQDYMAKYPKSISAVALSATNGPPNAMVKIGQLVTKIEKFRLGPHGHSPLILAMVFSAYNKAFAPNRTEFDWLSRDETEVDKYIKDPLCGFECSIETWRGMLQALPMIATKTALDKMDKNKPIFLFSGTDDPVGENIKGVKRLLAAYAKQGFSAISHRFYPGARHELLNETNRKEVIKDFLTWADGVVEHAS